MSADVSRIETKALAKGLPPRQHIAIGRVQDGWLDDFGAQSGNKGGSLHLPKGAITGVAPEAVQRDLALAGGARAGSYEWPHCDQFGRDAPLLREGMRSMRGFSRARAWPSTHRSARPTWPAPRARRQPERPYLPGPAPSASAQPYAPGRIRLQPTTPAMQAIELATHGPVIPVITLQRLDDAVPLARALLDGGIRVLELTLRTPVALPAMRAIVRALPDAIVGAGTMRSADDARAALDAGCRFGVSPGYRSELGRVCADIGLPLLPGVATAGEVMAATADGHHFLKFFPAEAAGGVAMLEALAGPFGDVRFCPTGGITPQSALRYLALPNVAVCGGSWLTPRAAVDARDWPRITALAQAASALRAA
jgi:2-dehydro-3-deoxyphosphogluconate aldolase/(4S)-4-hydroxy-2-oxoglutarate aldolase